MHEIDLKGVFLWAFLALEKMVLGRHLISLVPISFPLSKYRESWLNAELNPIWLSQSIACTDITNVVIVIETRNVKWESSSETIDGILPMTWVYVRHVIYSRKLTVDTSSLVKEIIVLINSNRAPVRDINIASCLGEVWKWIWEVEEQLNLTEGQRLNRLEWTVSHFRKFLASRAF
jgi:hypothetical protein